MPDGTGPDETVPNETVKPDEPIGQVLGDRLCLSCKFNLRGQAIVREGHYGLLIARCPECGTAAPLQEYPPPTKWAVRAATTQAIATVGFSILVALGAGAIAASILLAVRFNLVQDGYEDLRDVADVVFPVGVFWFAVFGLFVGIALSTIATHWRGWVRGLLPLPSIATGALVIASMALRQNTSRDPVELLLETTVMLGGAWVVAAMAGAFLGRMIARGVIRMLLPPRLRGPLAYLWYCDGLEPPRTRGVRTMRSGGPAVKNDVPNPTPEGETP